MKTKLALAFALSLVFAGSSHAADPLPSWNDTAPKQAIIAFFDKVIKETSADILLADRDPLANLQLVADPDKNFTVIMKGGKIHKHAESP